MTINKSTIDEYVAEVLQKQRGAKAQINYTKVVNDNFAAPLLNLVNVGTPNVSTNMGLGGYEVYLMGPPLSSKDIKIESDRHGTFVSIKNLRVLLDQNQNKKKPILKLKGPITLRYKNESLIEIDTENPIINKIFNEKRSLGDIIKKEKIYEIKSEFIPEKNKNIKLEKPTQFRFPWVTQIVTTEEREKEKENLITRYFKNKS